MMPAHQIWSCHVTEDANFEIFYFLFCSNSTFSIWKSHKISSGKAFHFLSAKNLAGGGGAPPVPLGLSFNSIESIEMSLADDLVSVAIFNTIRPWGGGGLRGPDDQTHSCQSETTYSW